MGGGSQGERPQKRAHLRGGRAQLHNSTITLAYPSLRPIPFLSVRLSLKLVFSLCVCVFASGAMASACSIGQLWASFWPMDKPNTINIQLCNCLLTQTLSLFLFLHSNDELMADSSIPPKGQRGSHCKATDQQLTCAAAAAAAIRCAIPSFWLRASAHV